MAIDFNDFFDDFDHYAYEVSVARHQDFARILKSWLQTLSTAPEPLNSRILWLQGLFPSDKLMSEVLLKGRGMVGSGKLNWPNDLENRLSAQLQLLDILTDKEDSAWQFAFNFFPGGGNNINDTLGLLVQHFYEPHVRELRRYLFKNADKSLTDRQNEGIPASDRIVSINHNQPEFLEVTELLISVQEDIRGNNRIEPEFKEQALAELQASQEILKAKSARYEVLKTLLFDGLKWLAKMLIGTTAEQIIVRLIAAVALLFGFPIG